MSRDRQLRKSRCVGHAQSGGFLFVGRIVVGQARYFGTHSDCGEDSLVFIVDRAFCRNGSRRAVRGQFDDLPTFRWQLGQHVGLDAAEQVIAAEYFLQFVEVTGTVAVPAEAGLGRGAVAFSVS